MKTRPASIVLVVVVIASGVFGLTRLAGASTPSVSLSASAGPAGTTITVMLPGECTLPIVDGEDGGVDINFASQCTSRCWPHVVYMGCCAPVIGGGGRVFAFG